MNSKFVPRLVSNSFYFLLPIACACVVILLIVFSQQSIFSARDALSLCFTAVIPTLFPFFVLSNLILSSGLPKLIGRFAEGIMRPLFNLPGNTILPFLLGVTAGYPTGAKVTVSMYESHLISKPQAERLLGFCNNSGPLFITGAVAVGMLKSPELGLRLFLCHVIASILVGILFGLASRITEKGSPKTKFNPQKQKVKDIMKEIIHNIKSNPGKLVNDSLMQAINTTLLVCGFILFFSTLTAITQNVFDNIYSNEFAKLPLLLLEITNGASQLAQATYPIQTKLVLISFVVGFGGISVLMQVAAICAHSKLRLNGYIKGKLLQGFLAAVLALFIF